MKTLFAAALAAGALAAASPAAAATPVATTAPIKFTLNMYDTGLGATTNTIGNNYKYQVTTAGGEKLDVMVSAWSRQLDNTIKQGTLASFGTNGLGIFQQGESRDGNFHQIDNVNGWEFVTLQFSRAVTLTGGTLNAFTLAKTDANGNPLKDANGNIVYRDYKDNDAFIGWGNNTTGAWNKSLSLQSYNWDQLSGSLMGSGNTNSDGTAAQTFNLTNAAANTWMIGGSINGPDSLNDAFKLAQLTVTAVPEPATWAMMLVGFAMVAGAARYRRRSTKVVYC
jgi:hypothetical protein